MNDSFQSQLSRDFVIHYLDTKGFLQSPVIPSRAFRGWSFLYQSSGETMLESQDRTFFVHGGEWVLVPPGVAFSVRYFHNCTGYIGGFVESFPKDRSYRVLRQKSLTKIRLLRGDVGLVEALLAALSDAPENPKKAAGLLESVLTLLDESLPTQNDRDGMLSDVFLNRVFDRSEPLLFPSDYAAQLGISANYLNRKVKEDTGHTVMEWIGNARLTRAKALLADKNLAMIDVAEAVGLPDQSYFSRFFKKETGMSPSEYRREVLGLHEKS